MHLGALGHTPGSKSKNFRPRRPQIPDTRYSELELRPGIRDALAWTPPDPAPGHPRIRMHLDLDLGTLETSRVAGVAGPSGYCSIRHLALLAGIGLGLLGSWALAYSISPFLFRAVCSMKPTTRGTSAKMQAAGSHEDQHTRLGGITYQERGKEWHFCKPCKLCHRPTFDLQTSRALAHH